MKPFDLEKALAGAPVVTRDGRKVEQMFYFDKAISMQQKLFAAIDGVIRGFSDNGRYFFDSSDECKLDLFMAPVKREGWVNLYREAGGTVRTGTSYLYETEEDARRHSDFSDYLGPFRIEWEE